MSGGGRPEVLLPDVVVDVLAGISQRCRRLVDRIEVAFGAAVKADVDAPGVVIEGIGDAGYIIDEGPC